MDERMDLSAVQLNAAERAHLVAAIMSRAQPELARRSVDVSPMLVLADWARPALAAAAVIALVCVSVLRSAAPHVEPGSGLTDALAVPAPMNEWLISDRAPTVADLLIALEVEGQ
jgi:hypothetical protein